MYPIKLKTNLNFIEQFKRDEESSYFDVVEDEQNGRTPMIDPIHHTYRILDRYTSMIEIRNKHELKDVYYRLGSGITAETRRKHCKTLQDKLKRRMKAEYPKDAEIWEIK